MTARRIHHRRQSGVRAHHPDYVDRHVISRYLECSARAGYVLARGGFQALVSWRIVPAVSVLRQVTGFTNFRVFSLEFSVGISNYGSSCFE
jgi:hypothetical protein